jgi:hypothetical protein
VRVIQGDYPLVGVVFLFSLSIFSDLRYLSCYFPLLLLFLLLMVAVSPFTFAVVLAVGGLL